MIRAFGVVALLLFASASPAHAQGCGPTNPNCIVSTAPLGDNSKRAASTAFVQSAFAGGSSLALANGKFFIGGLDGLAHSFADRSPKAERGRAPHQNNRWWSWIRSRHRASVPIRPVSRPGIDGFVAIVRNHHGFAPDSDIAMETIRRIEPGGEL
jgi:hypothetical protein